MTMQKGKGLVDLEVQGNNEYPTQYEVNKILFQEIIQIQTLIKVLFVDFLKFPEKEFDKLFEALEKQTKKCYPDELDVILKEMLNNEEENKKND